MNESQGGMRSVAEAQLNQREGLKRVDEPSPRPLSPFGNAGHFPIFSGKKGSNLIGLAKGPGAQNDGGGHKDGMHGGEGRSKRLISIFFKRAQTC